ncbi:MAG: uncharacterized protein HW415_1493 [Deltaproteobacteria bacterium]|nr:uncharacterized protein [Deltaproteobacteria bacterium]
MRLTFTNLKLFVAETIVAVNLLFLPVCLAEVKQEPFGIDVSISDKDIRQGDIVLVTVRAPGISSLKGEFHNNPIFFSKTGNGDSFTGIVGIDMTLPPGRNHLTLRGVKGESDVVSEMELDVKERKYEIERLTLPEKMVELDKEAEERADREALELKGVWEEVSGERLWDGKFALPVNGDLISNFGKKRVLNGKEKSPHNGIDISAPEGREVISPNNGRAVFAAEHFFGGKTLVIDHGQGLYTTYLHLSKVSVKVGDMVNRGDIIGLVGKTGRSTGPHLHWSSRLNKARIDPLKLFSF